jgi:hypothetical protein
MTQYLKVAADGKAFHRIQGYGALCLHHRSCNPHELEIRPLLLEGFDQVTTEQVAGSFSSYDSYDRHKTGDLIRG